METNEKISWLDEVTNEEVLKSVNEDRQILDSIWRREHRWIGHVLRHDALLHQIFVTWNRPIVVTFLVLFYRPDIHSNVALG